MVSVRSVPGVPGWVTAASSRMAMPLASRSATTTLGSPASCAWYCCSTPYWPPALAVDEAEQMGGQARVRSAARLRVDALGLGLERQPGDRPVGDRAADPVGDGPVEAVAQDQVLGVRGELVAQRDRLVGPEAEDRGQRRDRLLAGLGRQLVGGGDEPVRRSRRNGSRS